jgi:hypothetical protein
MNWSVFGSDGAASPLSPFIGWNQALPTDATAAEERPRDRGALEQVEIGGGPRVDLVAEREELEAGVDGPARRQLDGGIALLDRDAALRGVERAEARNGAGSMGSGCALGARP